MESLLDLFVVFNEHLKHLNQTDPCVYMKHIGADKIMIIFWVDDIILASGKLELIQQAKNELNDRFSMDDRGELRWFLGIDFIRDGDNYMISQELYADAILRRFDMSDCKPVDTPAAEKGLQLTKASDDQHKKSLTTRVERQ